MAETHGPAPRRSGRLAALFDQSLSLLITILTGMFFAGTGLLYIGDAPPPAVAVVMVAVSGVAFALLAAYAGHQTTLAYADIEKMATEHSHSQTGVELERLRLEQERVKGRVAEKFAVEQALLGNALGAYRLVPEAMWELLGRFRTLSMCPPDSRESERKRLFVATLRDICRVFGAENSVVQSGSGATVMAYTKATLLEPSADGKKFVRAHYHYPPGMTPGTGNFDLDYSTLAGKCFIDEKIVAVPDFAEAVKKKIARETREGQAEEYRGVAMACIPVMWSDGDLTGSPTVAAVLTIDSNVRRWVDEDGNWVQRRYFDERWSREDEAFLNTLFAPFLGLLRLLYSAAGPDPSAPVRPPSRRPRPATKRPPSR